MSQSSALSPKTPDPRLPTDLVDRTPPSMAVQSRRRVQQRCVVCAAAYLIVPAAAPKYQTCSPACTKELRSRQRRGRAWTKARRDAAVTKTKTKAKPAPVRTQAAQQMLPCQEQERTDLRPLGHGAVHVLCTRCGGLRGRWSTSELPPPELCWRCLMRRNAGPEPGIPLG